MREARKAKGLSMESTSRLLHISSKTYERWEKRGAVPNHSVYAVAGVLGLEIEEPAATSRSEDVVLAALEALAARLDRIEAQLDGLQSRSPVRQAAGSGRAKA